MKVNIIEVMINRIAKTKLLMAFLVLPIILSSQAFAAISSLSGEIIKVSNSKKLISVICDISPENGQNVVFKNSNKKNIFKAKFIKSKGNKCAFEITKKYDDKFDPEKGVSISGFFKSKKAVQIVADADLDKDSEAVSTDNVEKVNPSGKVVEKEQKTEEKDSELDKDDTPEVKEAKAESKKLDEELDSDDSPSDTGSSDNGKKDVKKKAQQDGIYLDEDEFFSEFDESSIESFSGVVYEPFDYGLSLLFGKQKMIIPGESYGMFGIKFHYNVLKKIYFKKEIQDSLTVEGGSYFHTLEFQDYPDKDKNYPTYRLFPIQASIRYNLYLVPGVMIYPYLGYEYTLVQEYNNEDGRYGKKGERKPESMGVFFGAGTMFKLGLGWAIRVDLGKEGFAVGASILF